MPFVYNKDRVNERVHGIGGVPLAFNAKGYAESDDEDVLSHFERIPGYVVYDEKPEDAGDMAVLAEKAPGIPRAPQAPASDETPPPPNPQAPSDNEFVAGYTREQLMQMTNAEIVDFANELKVVFSHPRLTKAQMVEELLASGN